MKQAIFSFFICLSLLTNLQAEVFILDTKQDYYSLESYVTFLAEGNTPYSINEVTTRDFQTIPNAPQYFKAHQYYWGKVQLENRLPDAKEFQEWILRFSNTWTELQIFVGYPNTPFRQLSNGTFIPHAEKNFTVTTEGNLIKLTLQEGEVLTIYFRGKSDRNSIPPKFDMSLQSSDVFQQTLQQRKINTSLFIGFVMMMLLYNLILYFFGRDSSYIYYSIYLLALVIYAPFISEDLADWFEDWLFPNHPEYLYFGKLVIYMGLMGYIAFIRSFLDLEKLLPKWDRFFNYLFWLGIPLLILDVVLIFKSNFSYVIADKVTVSYIILFVLSAFAFIYPLFKTKDKKGYFIVAGIIFMGLGFLFTAIARGLSPAFSLIYFKVGTILEIIAFSLGLAFRQREIERARQNAHFQLEKSKILQEQEQAEAKRLKELDQFKSQFYTNITHEFRTPLTVILGMTENIKEHQQEKNLIRRNSNQLLQLINQLLDLSKLESGNFKRQLIQSDIIAYLQYLTESFYSMAEEKNIRLTFYSEEEIQLMDYDENSIQHIIYNLLSNAIKFTPEYGKIILHVNHFSQYDKPFLKIVVKDTGKGISEAALPHIFERFYQVDSLKGAAQGTGIGLALTKELIINMGGKIDVHSELNKGTKFNIILPIENKTQLSLEKVSPNNVKHTLLESTEISQTEPVEKQQELPSLLLIEDNQDVVIYIKSILQNLYNLIITKNGQEGVDQALEQIPDIIISDVMMPKKNGYEVCEILKQDTRTSHIPIILLTAKSSEGDRIQGLKFGADAYLTKPFNKEELFIRLEKLVELRQKLHLHYSNLSSGESTPPIKEPTLEDQFIQQLKILINENLNDTEFGVNQLAKAALMSHTQVYRKIKALTGKTPSQFIRSIRLHKGLELVKTTNLNISEIAYDVGFSDPNYFSRTFQQEFGKAPRDIRK